MYPSMSFLSLFKKKVTIFARWQWRQRIRMYLEGTGINPTPVDLHELQLSLEQHSKAHRITTDTQSSTNHVVLQSQ